MRGISGFCFNRHDLSGFVSNLIVIILVETGKEVKTMPQTTKEEAPERVKLILIGEDDPDDQLLLKDIFSNIDLLIRLLFVDSGEQVLSALGKLEPSHRPCLIVLDYNMPGLNGAEILEVLNNDGRYQDIPKVVWSTSTSEKYRLSCLQLGATDYVIKPSNNRELEEIARYMLRVCVY
jgi:CheY-like chemotaxis protein